MKIYKYISFIPPVLMFFLIQKYALNIAHWDDHAVRYSVKNILDSSSILEQLNYIFKQHNEHRIVTTRLIALLSTLVYGQLEYRFLMWVGFLFLFFLLLIIRKLDFSYSVLLLFSLLIFHPAFYENTFWAMASVQNFGVIFFSILTAYYIAKDKFKFAIIAATISVFTSGNGIIILIAVFCNFLFFKDFKKAINCALFSFLILLLYYFNYTKIEDVVKTDFANIYLLQKGFVSMTGSWIDSIAIFSSKRLMIIYSIGFVNILFAGYIIIKSILNQKFNAQESFIFIVYLFVLGSIAATTISRIGYGIETLIGSKYKIYSFILLFLNLYSFSKILPSLKFVILGIALLINISLYRLEIQNLNFQNNERIAEFLNANPNKNHFFSNSNLKINNDFLININESQDEYDLFLADFIEDRFCYFQIQNELYKHYFPVDFRTYSIRNYLWNIKKAKVKISKSEIQTGQYQSFINYDSLFYKGKILDLKGITKQKIKQNW